MFVHKNQLEHLLQPPDYTSDERLAEELTTRFNPKWQIIGCHEQLDSPGKFLTAEVLGKPILIRNFDGEICAFLNVCSHRHCKLTSLAAGQSEKLACQYHGWQYKANGFTGHIPEARIFRPIDREQAQLTPVPLMKLGNLYFVNVGGLTSAQSRQEESTHELLQYKDLIEAWFGSPMILAKTWTTELAANWKVLIENSVESYHVPFVHPTSFGVAPPEEICNHELEPFGSRFSSKETLSWRYYGQSFLTWLMGLPISNVYQHQLIYPSLQLVNTDVIRVVISVQPLAVDRSRQTVWVFLPNGKRNHPWAWGTKKIMQRVVASETRRVLNEDAGIMAAVQQGLTHSPHRGVIGTREERVHAFQSYLMSARSAVPGP